MALSKAQPGDDIIANLYTRGFSLAAIAKGLGINASSVANRVARMQRQGFLERKHSVPEKTFGEALRDQRFDAEEKRRQKIISNLAKAI